MDALSVSRSPPAAIKSPAITVTKPVLKRGPGPRLSVDAMGADAVLRGLVVEARTRLLMMT
jgi:hypothetical protein